MEGNGCDLSKVSTRDLPGGTQKIRKIRQGSR